MGQFFAAGLGVAQIISWGTLYYAFPIVAVAMEGDLRCQSQRRKVAAEAALAELEVEEHPAGERAVGIDMEGSASASESA